MEGGGSNKSAKGISEETSERDFGFEWKAQRVLDRGT